MIKACTFSLSNVHRHKERMTQSVRLGATHVPDATLNYTITLSKLVMFATERATNISD